MRRNWTDRVSSQRVLTLEVDEKISITYPNTPEIHNYVQELAMIAQITHTLIRKRENDNHIAAPEARQLREDITNTYMQAAYIENIAPDTANIIKLACFIGLNFSLRSMGNEQICTFLFPNGIKVHYPQKCTDALSFAFSEFENRKAPPALATTQTPAFL